jgi:hypothetical protein
MANQVDREMECSRHGVRPVRFVCIHVARATDSGSEVGFFWAEQEDHLPPIAWCNACETWLREPGASWNEDFKKLAQFVPFCSDCYELAKQRLSTGFFTATASARRGLRP